MVHDAILMVNNVWPILYGAWLIVHDARTMVPQSWGAMGFCWGVTGLGWAMISGLQAAGGHQVVLLGEACQSLSTPA